MKIKDIGATKLSLDGQEQSFECETDQTVYQEHTAIMLFEFYKHNGVWKMCANGQGFNGGLAALIRHFGGDVEDTPNTPVTPPTPVKPAKISLEKVFEKEKPRLVNLAKQADQVILTKGLNDVVARVIIVLDASGSMHGQYIGGDVQRTVERIVPLAVKFDDNATLECYAFADKCKQLTDVTLANIDNYLINEGLRNYGGDIGIGGSNNEERVIKQIMEDTKGSKLPIFVVFICDGGVGNDAFFLPNSAISELSCVCLDISSCLLLAFLADIKDLPSLFFFESLLFLLYLITRIYPYFYQIAFV